jgi:uncharacterized protein YodC (DUF2158 family)
MSIKFKIGDTVQLKSGGPAMTVKQPDDGPHSDGECLCQWFGGRKLEQGYFHRDTLRKIEVPSGS